MTEYSANDQQNFTEALEDLYAEHFFAGSGFATDDLSAEGLAHPEGVEVRYLRASSNTTPADASADDGLDCVAGDGDDRGDGFFEVADRGQSYPGAFSGTVTLRAVNSCSFDADEAAEFLADAGLVPLDANDPGSLEAVRDAVEGVAELLAGADASVSELFRALKRRNFGLVEEGLNGVWVPVAVSPDGTAAGVIMGRDGTVRASVRAGGPSPEAPPETVPSPAEDALMDGIRAEGGAVRFLPHFDRDPVSVFALASRGDVSVLSGGPSGEEPVVVASTTSRDSDAVRAVFARERILRRARWELAEHLGGRTEPVADTVQGKLWDASERGGFAEEVAVGRGLGRTRHVVAPGEGGPIAGLSDETVRAMDADERAALVREQATWVNGRRAALASDPAAVGFAARVLAESAATPAGASFKASKFLHPLGPKGLDPRMIRWVALSRAVPAVLRREGARVPASLLALSVLVARILARQVLRAVGPNPYGSAAEGKRVAERAERRMANAAPVERVVPAAELDGKRNTPARRRARRKEYLGRLFAEALELRSAPRIALDTARACYLLSLSEDAPSERVRLMLARSEGGLAARSRLKGLGLLDAARELVETGEASAKRRRSDGRAFLVAVAGLDREAALARYRRGVLSELADPEGGIFVPGGTRLAVAVLKHRHGANGVGALEEAARRTEEASVAAELAVA
jgi:hypothetical protein